MAIPSGALFVRYHCIIIGCNLTTNEHVPLGARVFLHGSGVKTLFAAVHIPRIFSTWQWTSWHACLPSLSDIGYALPHPQKDNHSPKTRLHLANIMSLLLFVLRFSNFRAIAVLCWTNPTTETCPPRYATITSTLKGLLHGIGWVSVPSSCSEPTQLMITWWYATFTINYW